MNMNLYNEELTKAHAQFDNANPEVWGPLLDIIRGMIRFKGATNRLVAQCEVLQTLIKKEGSRIRLVGPDC